MPNPCPPNVLTNTYGPFRIGFTVELPVGYVDQEVSSGPGGIIKTTELTQILTAAWDQETAELTVSVGGRSPVVVSCGTDPLVFKGSPFHREPEDGPDETDAWVVQVWIYAPDAPSSVFLDFPYIARLWAAGLQEVSIPEYPSLARLTLTHTVYLENGRFIGVLPTDYEPPPAETASAPTL